MNGLQNRLNLIREVFDGLAASARLGELHAQPAAPERQAKLTLDRGYVVDHRTGHRLGAPEAVLGGGLREFASAFLRLARAGGAPWAS